MRTTFFLNQSVIFFDKFNGILFTSPLKIVFLTKQKISHEIHSVFM